MLKTDTLFFPRSTVPAASWPSLRTARARASCRMLATRVSATRRLGRTRIRAVCACAAPVGLCGWLFGIAPFCGMLARGILLIRGVGGAVPRPVVLDVVLLDLLDVVVGLRAVHAFRAEGFSERLSRMGGDILFPCEVSQKTHWR
jgi:hypothetical protein